MKKIICILLIAVMAVIGLMGCEDAAKTNQIERFEALPYKDSVAGWMVRYYYDKETKVVYICRGDGGISPLLEADGTPMLYDEFMESIEEGQ